MKSAILLVVFLVVSLAAGPGGPVPDAEAGGAPATWLSGWLHIIYGDAPPGGGNQTHTHLLVDDAGNATQLVVPESVVAASGGRHALNRRRVTIVGHAAAAPSATTLAGGLPLMTVHALQPEGPQGLPAPTGQEQAVSGPQKWASILCRFADSAGFTPYPKTWFETLMLGSAFAPGLDHYWRAVSFNNVNLTGSGVYGWYTLPQPRSYYVYGNPSQLDFQRAANDCTGAADADVNFPSYVGINLMFNDNLDCCAWGGSTTLTRDGQTRSYRITWLPPWGYENQGVIAHEMGHGFGLPHSSGPYADTYDSRWDVMSDLWGNCPPYDPDYGCVGPHTISYHKDILGWIPSSRKYLAAAGTSQTIALEPLDQLASSGSMMAQIPILGSSTNFYTVETRRLAGYDAPIPGHAVIIHKVDTMRSDRDAQVVDPDANGNPDDAGSMWLPGEAFVDSPNGISVAVTAATSNGFFVTVTNDTGGGISYILSVTLSEGAGTVTSSPSGISCSAGTCFANFASGATVTLTPGGGTLTGWGGACTGVGSCAVTMSGNRSVTATFAVPPPDITVSPLSLAFGAMAVGSKSSTKALTVRNEGGAGLALGTISLGGGSPDQFVFPLAQDFCSGRTLAPGQSCAMAARFKPQSVGAKSATLVIPSNDPDENPVTIALDGTGSSPVFPDITVTPLSVSFGNVPIGSKSVRTVTVVNDGTASLALGAVSLNTSTSEIIQPVAQDFCSGRTLALAQSCTVMVKLKPSSQGAKNATLAISSNDPDESLVTVTLSGTASSAASPDVTVTPLSVSFGTVPVGAKSTRTVTVTNDGAANLVLGALTLSASTTEITTPVGQDFCSGITLAPGQSCAVMVKLKATSAGAKTATLSIPSNDPDEDPVNVSVTGAAN